MMTRTALIIAVVIAVASAGHSRETVPHHELTVGAAASLADAFEEIGAEFERAHPTVTVECNFAASGALATQIELGAPVDVFTSASEKDTDRLEGKHLLVPGTRMVFATIAGLTQWCFASAIYGWLFKPKDEVPRNDTH